jgi:hypothetical protein
VSEDWKVGDLALCIDGRPNPGIKRNVGIEVGRTYRVAGLTAGPTKHDLYGTSPCGLLIEGLLSGGRGGAFSCLRFRKIRPDEHEDCEPEFVELLKRSRVKA